MKIDHLVLGEFETNCYIVRVNESAGDCVIIDTGLDAGPLMKFLTAHKLKPVAIVLTHGHIDHIAGVDAVRQAFPAAKVFIHKLDAGLLADDEANLSVMAGMSLSVGSPVISVEEGDVIHEAGIDLKVIHTPGHTPGGICLYAEDDNIVFTGDALFAGSIGRTDFPGGNLGRLLKGIKEKILTLPPDTVVYPGHGPATTVGEEKAGNPFLGSSAR